MRSFLPAGWLLLALSAVSAGCAPESVELSSEDASADEDALSSSISKTLGPLKLTLQTKAKFEDRDGKRALVVSGSANRNLSNVFSFIPDDGFGHASLLTDRKFELVLSEAYEINTLLSGLPILLSVQTVSGSPQSFVARISLASSFARFSGSSKVFVESPIKPVFFRATDNLRYRGRAHVTGGASALSVLTPDNVDPEVTAIDADSFRFDWHYDGFVLAADPPSDHVQLVATTPSGTRTKNAGIDIYVSDLAITTDDPYEVWAAVCDDAVLACLQATPLDQVDLSACGSYRDVQKCIHLVGQ